MQRSPFSKGGYREISETIRPRIESGVLEMTREIGFTSVRNCAHQPKRALWIRLFR